jgi:hypothetical protein
MRTRACRGWLCVVAGVSLLLAATAAIAQDEQGLRFFRKGTLDGTADGMTEAEFKAAFQEYFPAEGSGVLRPSDIPDIFGPGAVLSVGSVLMKVTNFGVFGNPWGNLSSDPSGQWPGASGVEYLNFAGVAVGAVNPQATDPNAIRRVSQFTEWRPPSLASVDKMYRAYDGIVNGARFKNDDEDAYVRDERLYRAGDQRFDEDFLDGIDNDLDGKIDEDFGALGQQTITCRMNDYTVQSINATASEKHVPLGLDIEQMAWAYSIPGYTEFNVVQYTIYNRSGHLLDSLVVGGMVDMDCGPVTASSYWQDDVDLAGFPSCVLPHMTENPRDMRLQGRNMRTPGVPSRFPDDSALCSNFPIRINGFSVADDNGDLNLTKGVPTFLLVNHTIDPELVDPEEPLPERKRGKTGPWRVGFLAFRSYTGNTPYVGGGAPRNDQQRFEFMSGAAGTNIATEGAMEGLINQDRGDEKGDYQAWWSCGPWKVPDGGSVQVTVAFTVAQGDRELAYRFSGAYLNAVRDGFPQGGKPLVDMFPSLANAVAVQVAYEGIWAEAPPGWTLTPNGHGRETPVHPSAGEGAITAKDCRDQGDRTVNYVDVVDWFDFDCDYCTGAYDGSGKGIRTFHNTWNAEAPPPNPNLNVTATYNYNANPSRVIAAGDNQVTLAWDNISEVTPDPKTGWLDFRGYRVWKAANWQRPVGSAGPSDNDWSLLGEFRQFHQWARDSNRVWRLLEQNSTRVFVPSHVYPVGSAHCPGGCIDSATVDLDLRVNDLWNPQTGEVIRASEIDCMRDPESNECMEAFACINGRDRALECPFPAHWEHRTRYPVGRYKLLDSEVKNGFVYFYSVTAFDSTGEGPGLEGRRSATEADGVMPQAMVRPAKSAWVVPNPYRGYRNIADRPSSWDLTPNGSDPTGTHIDFLGLPRGRWTIKIFTVSGDLVQTIRSDDPVNESVRASVPGPGDTVLPGYNRQQDNPDDGQASWNLISRNGQDIVSGIYIYTVESDGGTQRGKFVVIR